MSVIFHVIRQCSSARPAQASGILFALPTVWKIRKIIPGTRTLDICPSLFLGLSHSPYSTFYLSSTPLSITTPVRPPKPEPRSIPIKHPPNCPRNHPPHPSTHSIYPFHPTPNPFHLPPPTQDFELITLSLNPPSLRCAPIQLLLATPTPLPPPHLLRWISIHSSPSKRLNPLTLRVTLLPPV